jgi:tRNA(His) guanylyltransferase
MNTQTNTPSIGDRMKGYENVTRHHLIRRMPVILRLDGKAWHTFTRGLDKPYDIDLSIAMGQVSEQLIQEFQGAVIAYTQSDEISIFLRDYDKLVSESWFDNNIQKIVSVASSIATGLFNQYFTKKNNIAFFDCRAFNLPKEEVINYFIWRQQDAMRNSVQGLGQAELGSKHIQGLNNKQVQEELLKKSPSVDWNKQPEFFKYGQTYFKPDFVKGSVNMPTPIFKENRDFLNELIYIKDKE